MSPTPSFFRHMPMPEKAPPSNTPPLEPSTRENSSDWTVRRLLRWTTDYFHEAGFSSPRLDAEILLAHALEKDRLYLYLHYESHVQQTGLKAFRQRIQRRMNSEPVAYITGTREFYSIPFSVDPSVLIPRPETEHLVEHSLRHLKEQVDILQQAPLRILDLGTGCGNISIALAKHLPEARIVSVDISAGALATAKENLTVQTDPCGKVLFVQGDLLEWLAPNKPRFHIVVSNPPYVTTEEWEQLPLDVRDHEPKVALVAGSRGTEFQERILRDAAPLLLSRGILVMEIGESQEEDLLESAQGTGLYGNLQVLTDFAGKPRVLVAEK